MVGLFYLFLLMRSFVHSHSPHKSSIFHESDFELGLDIRVCCLRIQSYWRLQRFLHRGVVPFIFDSEKLDFIS